VEPSGPKFSLGMEVRINGTALKETCENNVLPDRLLMMIIIIMTRPLMLFNILKQESLADAKVSAR